MVKMELAKYYKIGLFVLFPLVVFLLLDWFFGFQGLYGQDSYAYLDYTRILTGEYANSELNNQFLWPKGYSFLGFLFHQIGLTTHFALRLISLLSLLGSVVLISKILKKVYKEDGFLFVFLAAVTQIYFLRSGLLVMSDSLAVMLMLSAIYFFILYIEKNSILYFLLLCLFTLGAVFTRYAVGVILIIPCTYATYLFLKNCNSWARLGIIVSAAILSFLVLWLNSDLLKETAGHFKEWEFINFFTLNEGNQIRAKLVPNLLYVLGNFGHLGYLSFGVILIPFYRKIKKESSKILALSLVVYFIFIGGLATQNYRFLVISHPLVLILLYPAFSRLELWLRGKKLLFLFASSVFIFNIAFGIFSFSKTYEVFAIEKEISEKIKKIEQGESIYSFYVDQSFPSYGIKNKVYNFYKKEYPTFEKGSLVIFNPIKFEKQWEGQTVMNNWSNLTKNYSLDTIYNFKNNWTLYRIK